MHSHAERGNDLRQGVSMANQQLFLGIDCGTLAEHLTADGVEDDGFGALGAAVDAEE